MRAIKVIEPGTLATVQDQGRFGFRDKGVPACGAMDLQALRLGNLLVGNAPDAACVEITLGGFVAEFGDKTCFALTGADTAARLNGRPIASWKPCFAQKGDLLETETPALALRTYLAVRGAIEVSPVMSSRSTFLKGGLGGLEGRALKKGDVLFFGDPAHEEADVAACGLPAKLVPQYSKNTVLRVLPGPQIERVSRSGLEIFFSSEYVVSSRSDRMGIFLCGPPVELSRGADIISDGAFPGAVQVPGNGQPVILGKDCQTTGGYVKIASVIEVDLSLAGQLAPGSIVRFAEVSLDEARLAYLKNEYRIRRLYETSATPGGKKCEWT